MEVVADWLGQYWPRSPSSLARLHYRCASGNSDRRIRRQFLSCPRSKLGQNQLSHAGLTRADAWQKPKPEVKTLVGGRATLNYSEGLDAIRSFPRVVVFSRIRLISRTRAMNFCKSCSFEAISARCFKRSSLSVMRKKYSSLCYSFRPPLLVEQASPLLPQEYGASAVFWRAFALETPLPTCSCAQCIM